ncbi:helix-turn-helix transcriptional regulator [Qipengyuania sp. 6B39]|uniref:helix-turn-helix domain-containing protein n=1 Tax=Qipengyuania proteolytica TaxID=2867239 RepID=UPI001C895FC9|nr:helix-turn-helix transcriptional regulator [Qipengyuania proteolytica]MBX7496999.1 helix-turn-helix transcriptional regulator [Qipengyuania proteolytica]
MGPHLIHDVFASLTDKQHEALRLVCRHYTSKQIALELGVSPVTIDKRIEGIRAKLEMMPRVDIARHYAAWSQDYDRPIDDPTIVAESAVMTPRAAPQPPDFSLPLADALSFDGRASWDRESPAVRPRLSPEDLGPAGKLLFLLAGAIALLAVVVLLVTSASVWSDFVGV